MLYIGGDFEGRYHLQGRLGRPLWLQKFLWPPSGSTWSIWQAQGFASVDGISGDVDLDVMRAVPG